MKKKNSLILDLDDSEMNLFSKQYLNLADIHEEIEKLFDEGDNIDKRKRKVYNEWKEKINFLIDMYNAKAKFKSYERIK